MSEANAGIVTGAGNLGVLSSVDFFVRSDNINSNTETILNKFATTPTVDFITINAGYLQSFVFNFQAVLLEAGEFNQASLISSPSSTFASDVTVLQVTPIGYLNDDDFYNFTGTFISEPNMYYALTVVGVSDGGTVFTINGSLGSFSYISQLALVA
jgi:hypothetical protein